MFNIPNMQHRLKKSVKITGEDSKVKFLSTVALKVKMIQSLIILLLVFKSRVF